MKIIVGLGNPGQEYQFTRHNAGRFAVLEFQKKNKLPEFALDKKLNALKSEGGLKKEKILLILPETFMNKSGLSLKKLISSRPAKGGTRLVPMNIGTAKKQAANLIVVHDDIDLGLGKLKISFARNSGGHKGVESIIKNIKTKDFVRIRIGIAPTTAAGKIKKPKNDKHLDFLTQKFKPEELQKIKQLSKKISLALETLLTSGLQKAMNEFN